jgi:hypothetical protein
VTVLLWLLAALAVTALFSPWHLRLSGRTVPPSASAELRLLAGHAPPIPIPLGPRGGRQARGTKRKRKKSHHRAPLRGTAALIRGIVSSVRLDRLTLAGRIGFDDPADTGHVWGLLVPLIQVFRGPRRRIDLAPDFAGPCLDLEATGEIAILPLRLIRAGAIFAWTNRRAP